jgi:hypothetical protein
MTLSTQHPRAVRATGLSLLVALLLSFSASAQTPAAKTEPAAVVGTWEGKYHSVPAITLNIKADGDKLSGTAIFYRIVDRGDGAKVDGQVEVDLIEPKLVGASLLFKVKPPAPPGTGAEAKALEMELKLTGADEGLVITKRAAAAEGEDEEGGPLMQLKVTRKK